MILNLVKCHYMCLGKCIVNDILKFCDKELGASTLKAELGIEIN